LKREIRARGQVRFGRVSIRALGFVGGLAFSLPAWAQAPTQEEIQKNREQMEKKKQEYYGERAKVEEFNTKVERYKQLRESIPFSAVVGTSNLVQVYISRQNTRDICQQLYGLADTGKPGGFDHYWRTFLALNQGNKYDGGVPLYGPLDPTHPEENVAVFPNIRKHGLEAAVAVPTREDTAFAYQLTAPVVAAYERRLREGVNQKAAALAAPADPSGPATMNAEPQVELFRGQQAEPAATYPPRRITDETQLAAANRVERKPVPVDQAIALDPAPPAWALRQEVNMLGPNYQGYNVEYQPGNFELLPEGGAMAFFGGRDAQGEAATQPGVFFSFNQKIYHLLLFSETAFAAFSAADAPAVNGGNIGGGLDFDIGMFNIAGTVGISAFNVAGETTSGVSFTGKLRFRATPRLYVGAIAIFSNAEHFQSNEGGIARTGVTDPGFVGVSASIR
jgi:hypothetical protein